MTRTATSTFTILSLLLAICLAGCSKQSEAPVTTTNNDAHQRLIELMQRNADTLQVTLAQALPGISTSTQGANAVPCDQNNDAPDQAYRWKYRLWALLPNDVSATVAIGRLEQGWRVDGYDIRDSGDDTLAETSDGAILTTTTSGQGYLSVIAQSSCFPKTQLNRAMSWPDAVRPAT